jgi:plasmid stabilization system protein ParE
MVIELEEQKRRILDYYFGEGTAERWAVERIIRECEDEKAAAVADGRRREGNATTWYASITWSRNAWYALHGMEGPRR